MQPKTILWAIVNFFVKDPGVISAGLVRFAKVTLIGLVGSLAVAPFWKDGLTEIGYVVIVGGVLLGLEKMLKNKIGIGLAVLLGISLSIPAQAEMKILQLEPKNFAIGGGSMLGEESLTFSKDAAFAAFQWHGIALFGENGSSGIGLELHPASILSDGDEVQSVGNADWRFWSLNRVKMSAFQLPGEIWETMYLGSDLLIEEGGGHDYSGDFSARFVYGVHEGPFVFEVYMFEKYRPISVAIFYSF